MAESENNPSTLTDEELKDVAGAGFLDGTVEVKDTRGRVVGEYVYGVLLYCPCPNCGRPTHEDWGRHWCDKCDGSWAGLTTVKWTGSVDELKVAGAAN